MNATAVFAGSFDPFTRGHEDIALRALDLFEHLVIGVGVNASKRTFFSLESRIAIIRDTFAKEPRIEVRAYNGLTTDFCNELGARFLLRGVRSATDFDYESAIAQANKMIAPRLETVFLLTRKEYLAISSTVVRDLLRHGGDVRAFLPQGIEIANYPQES